VTASCIENAFCDVIDRAGSIDGFEQILPLIVLNERLRTLLIDLETIMNRFRSVIGPLDQGAAATITASSDSGRIENDIEHRPAVLTRQAPTHSTENLVDRHFHIDHIINRFFQAPKEFAQGFGLPDRAWETIEDESTRAIRSLDPFADNTNHHIVWH
jgi:hypothetical protein